MTFRQHNAEGQPSGTALTAANSGGGSGDAFQAKTGSGVIAYSNAQAAHGTQSLLINETTLGANVTWSGLSGTDVASRAYVRWNTVPAAVQDIMFVESPSGTILVRVTSTGLLRVTNILGSTLTTFATAMTTGQWYRVEVRAVAGTTTTNGTIAFAYYVGDSLTPVETAYSATNVNAGTTAFTGGRYMKLTSSASHNAYWDDVAFNDAAAGAFIGPVAPTVKAGTAIGSVAWSGSAAGAKTTRGASTGSLAWSGSAVGSRPARGTAASLSEATVESVTTGSNLSVAAGGTLTFAHTINPGVTVLVVAVQASASSSVGTIAGASYAGQSMTRIGGAFSTGSTTAREAVLYQLSDPPVGTGNIVLTARTGGTTYTIVGTALSLVGASGATGTPANTASASTNTISGTTTAPPSSLTVSVVAARSTTAVSGGGGTSRQNAVYGSNNAFATNTMQGGGTSTYTWPTADAAALTSVPMSAAPATGVAWTGTAVGQTPAISAAAGTANGSVAWVGTAAGRRVAAGSSTGSVAFTGTAVGRSARRGTATAGTVAWVGTAVGRKTPRGAAAGTATWTGTATGKRVPKATAAGALAWSGTATGTQPTVAGKTGTATGGTTWTGTAAGRTSRRGAAGGVVTWAATSTGRRTPKASATGVVAWSGTAVGVKPVVPPRIGTANGTVTWVGAATGTTMPLGTALGSTLWAGNASGFTPVLPIRTGTTQGVTAWSGVAVGVTTIPGRDVVVTIVGPYYYPFGLAGPYADTPAVRILGPYATPARITGPMELTE
jgi:hypothetical protein